MRNGPDLKTPADRLDEAGESSAVADSGDDYKFPSARGVLTADEIQALLRPQPQQGALDTPPIEAKTVTPREAVLFDQETPVDDDTPDMQRGQILASRLTMALGKGTGIKAAINVSQQATVARSDLPGLLNGKSSAVACLGPSETDIHALVCLPPQLADAVIAKACGARGSTGRIGDGWSLSAIDCALLEQLLEPFGGAVSDELMLQSIETDIPYVSSLLPASDVSITEFLVEAAGLHSELAVIEGRADAAEETATTELKSAPVTALATARLASLSVPLSRLTALKAGSTLLLGLPPDQPVELLSGGRDGEPAYEGQMGRKGNKVALKLTKKLRTFES